MTEPNAIGPGIPPLEKQQRQIGRDHHVKRIANFVCVSDPDVLSKKTHSPNVRTTIHWMPSPKDLWLSGTHLKSKELVRHAGMLDLKLICNKG